MAKRMIVMLVVTLAIVGGLGFLKFRQIQAAIAQGASFAPPPEAVTTIVAESVEWPNALSAIGTAAAVQGVTVSTDVPGTIDKISFDSGQWVRAGDVLVRLDARQERAQLASIEAQRDLARLNFARMKDLLTQRVISQAEFDRAMTDQTQSEAQAGEITTVIERKTIRAPFSGLLGIRQVSLGQYVGAGDPIVQLQSLDPIYVNFGVPQQDAGRLGLGRTVRIVAGADDGVALGGQQFTGRITAIDAVGAGDHPLERRGDEAADEIGVGTNVHRGHADHRDVAARVLAHAQRTDRLQPRDEDDEVDDDGEDRPPDEEIREAHHRFSGVGVRSFAGRTLLFTWTAAPLRSLNTPEVTTSSPGFSPSMTATWSPRDAPTFTNCWRTPR